MHRIDSHRRSYPRRLTVSTAVAALAFAIGLWLAPEIQIRPYALDDEAIETPSGAFRILPPTVTIVQAAVFGDPQPSIELDPTLRPVPYDPLLESWTSTPPAFDRTALYAFEPLPSIRSRALFTMTPIFSDALPRHLDLDKVVVVKARLGSRGQVLEAYVHKGIDRVLDEQALVAAWQCRLEPRDSEQSAWVTLPYEFHLD